MKNYIFIAIICLVAGGLYLLTRSPFSPGRLDHNVPQGTQTQDKQKSNPASPKTQNPTGITNLAQQLILASNLPEHIQIIVQEYWHNPDWTVAKGLTPADEDILLQLYRQEPSLVKKHSLTVALGLIGDEKVVDVFKHALSDEYAGRKLIAGTADKNEEFVMIATVSVMGFLAKKSDSAYDLLKKGMEPKFWKGYCKFIPANDPGLYGNLANDAIRAIGWSCRPDVTNVLESLKPLPLVNDLDKSIMQMSFEGAVCDAAFANDIIAKEGLDYYKVLYLDLDASMARLHEWTKSPVGLEWNKWYQKKKME